MSLRFRLAKFHNVLLLWFLTVTFSCCPYLYFGSAINMLVTFFVNFRWLNDHLFGKELFIRFTTSAFRKLLSVYVFSYFPFGFEGRMWNLIVSVLDHCLSFYKQGDPVAEWLRPLIRKSLVILPLWVQAQLGSHVKQARWSDGFSRGSPVFAPTID